MVSKTFGFAPSLMCMDLFDLQAQLAFFEDKVSYLHVDIMDGHFVKNLTLSPWFISQIRPRTKVKIDAHLMVTHPQDLLTELINIDVDCISPHIETLLNHAFSFAFQVKDAGKELGIVISPETDISALFPILHYLDKITVMTIDPGFAGARFIPHMPGFEHKPN
ncbi:hypothetical protein AGMMS49992_33130 [Clostridia bacterium]|nr:hypothetical protein AGMMS49992_33130 [Clostridia bacterium]